MDLLLHLINKHELDILDIPIAFITEKYLAYIDLMKSLDLDLASEYLEMAATLALIKSRMLVPSDPSGDDEEIEDGPDPREELVRRLLEYQKYKTAADELAERPMLGRDTFPRGFEEEITGEREFRSPGLFSLIEAFQEILKRAKPESSHEVSITRISVSARINQLVDILRKKQHIAFLDLFGDAGTRSDMVVTLLSLLEMSRLGLTRIHQTDLHGEIYITAAPGIENIDQELVDQIEEE